MLKRVFLGIGVILALVLVATPTALAELTSRHLIEATLRADGDVEVRETITLRGDWTATPLTRSFWLRPAQDAWPLSQSVVDVSVVDDQGKALSFRERAYYDRSNIDLLEIPESGVLVLGYRIHRGLRFEESRATLRWMITGYQWTPHIESISLRVTAPHALAAGDTVAKYQLGYSDDVHALEATATSDALIWEFTPAAPSWAEAAEEAEDEAAEQQPGELDEPIAIDLDLARGEMGPAPPEWFFREWTQASKVPLAALLLLTVLGFLLIVVRPWRAVVATSIANFVPVVPAVMAGTGVASYWHYEGHYRNASDDLYGEAIINFGLAGFVLLFAWQQRRTLLDGKRAAYFTQLAFPAVLIAAWPIAFVDRGMIIFPLLAVPIYFYWPRRKLALEFGVGAHRISEEVGGRGQVSVADLAAHLRITPKSLLKALRQNPHLPIVLDHAHQMVLSAEAAAMRDELRVCTFCGGATEAAGMAVRKCGYCEREFTSGKTRRTEKPLPVVIESLAIFFSTLALSGYFFAGLVAVAFLSFDIAAGTVAEGLILAAVVGGILAIPPVLLGRIAAGLRKGKKVGAARVLLMLSFWLIAPLFVLRKLSSKRVRIFTGEFDTAELAKHLEERGEWSLEDFAAYLQSNQEDAAELAQYLAVNQIIDAVYDRRAGRLVSRRLYREIAREGSCHQCGGFFGVQQGRATCHFCGASAS